jgi:S1-C subfamily serine protease
LSFKFVTKRLAALFFALFLTGALTAVLGQGAGSTPPAMPPATPQDLPPVVKPRLTTGVLAPVAVAAQTPVAQPQQVITIVHRLSGWRLKTWLAFTNAKVLDPSLINQFVYTNIVAGYVLGDGRSVVARLPEADAEMFSLPAELGYAPQKNGSDASGLTLVRRDGARLAASFVGLDGSTWLTLMQAEGLSLTPSREASEGSLAVGQRVRLFAPLRAEKTQPGAVSETAVYMRVGELKGTITDIARASTGSVTRLTVRAEGLSPQVVGGVVLNEAGETVGLVETSSFAEARVMPASIVKRAAERVLQRRASVPRPLLGVRGEAIAATTLKQLETIGWKQEEASKLLTKQQGVLLTMVTPNSPAALADLRAGDIIVNVNKDEVKTSEDLSFLLNEAGGGASVQVTLLRMAETMPREITVKLSEAFNLRRATEMSFTGFQNYANLYSSTFNAATANMKRDLERLYEIGAGAQAGNATTTRAVQITSIVADLDCLIVPADKAPQRSLAPSVLLINVVRAGSPAAKLGLRAGDVVVTVNGETLAQNEWAAKFMLRKASDLTLIVMRGRGRVTLTYEDK